MDGVQIRRRKSIGFLVSRQYSQENNVAVIIISSTDGYQ